MKYKLGLSVDCAVPDTIGNEIYELAQSLWPIDRSLTGDGVRDTLKHIKKNYLPNLRISEVPSGTRAFDWVVPKEWRIRNAWIITPSGKKICDYKENNLNIVGYSEPINKKMLLRDLDRHLYSLPNQPEAIPYITSYYESRWGFCMTHTQRMQLEEGEYEVFIDSELFDGSLTYGELLIEGQSKDEIFLSTYVCHPSLANNELSGPCVTTFIAKYLSGIQKTRFSYRILFIPETIGSILYLSQNLDYLKNNVIAGYNITCVGDNRSYSFLSSRNGNTISDRAAKHVLEHIEPSYIVYDWSERGSDERQYCAPGVDLPIASIMRSKYHCYPEYHTSLDKLGSVVTPEGLLGGYKALLLAIEAIETNCTPKAVILCEPQLGKRGLYSNISTKISMNKKNIILEVMTWADGTMDLLDIANKCGVPIWDLYEALQLLLNEELITIS